MKQAAVGKNPMRNYGGCYSAATSPHWRRRQGYSMYIPESLDLTTPAPLMILLHGSGGDYRNLIADEAAGQRFEEHPMIIANAGAYANQEYRHLAFQDILAVLEDVSAKYSIDPDRIYLQGISLGGRGVLEAAALKPDLFAAVSSQGLRITNRPHGSHCPY